MSVSQHEHELNGPSSDRAQHASLSSPPNSGAPPGVSLSEHDLEYLRKRAVTAEVANAAGYWTARKPSEHPKGLFSEPQRRRTPTLIAPHMSPDGVSVGYQKHDLRPGRDRSGDLIKWASPKGGRLFLGTHPWTMDEVRGGTGRLWLPEGLTRMHALTGLGEAAASYAGCWAWRQGGEPLPCFDYINLEGRLVLDVPDADYGTNENVQKALAERVAFLESRGARVLVVSVPEVNGDPTAGLDDYLAAGGDPEALVRDARPYVPVDTGRERLKKNERLRVLIAAKTLELDRLPTRTEGECNAAKLARWMLENPAPAHGKLRAGGAAIHPSFPQMAEGIRVGSFQTVRKALHQLEAAGFLKRVPGPRGKRQASRYLLLHPPGGGRALGVKVEGTGDAGKESQEQGEEGETSLSQRESSPRLHSTHTAAASGPAAEKVPPLRSSKLAHTFIWHEGRRVVVHSDYFRRYGPKREEIIRYVLQHGVSEVAELRERFGARTCRPGRFFATWIRPMLDDGVFVGDSGSVQASPDWPAALERVRERGHEDEDNRRQSEKYAQRRRKYHERLESEKRGAVAKTDPTPELVGPERIAEIVAKADARDQAARVEEQRAKVGTTPEVFIADALQDASGFGWRELRALWIAKGGKPEHLRRAVKPPYRFRREHDGGPLYVVKAGNTPEPEREPAPVAVLREPGEDWRSHALDCECVECLSPLPIRYARARSGA